MEKAIEKLIRSGRKLTRPRLAILKFLSHQHAPISAQTIHDKTGIDLASVYRTLKLSEELRLANVEAMGNEKRYCLAAEPHHHITCRKCGHSETVRCNHVTEGLGNFTDISHQLTITGICDKCRK
ncbi:transcriptional repressor [Candidatus Uhrbacteria bacterium]|nr:transcriptional repressor [Candidatus Uhrbacteria bacterium]